MQLQSASGNVLMANRTLTETKMRHLKIKVMIQKT